MSSKQAARNGQDICLQTYHRRHAAFIHSIIITKELGRRHVTSKHDGMHR